MSGTILSPYYVSNIARSVVNWQNGLQNQQMSAQVSSNISTANSFNKLKSDEYQKYFKLLPPSLSVISTAIRHSFKIKDTDFYFGIPLRSRKPNENLKSTAKNDEALRSQYILFRTQIYVPGLVPSPRNLEEKRDNIIKTLSIMELQLRKVYDPAIIIKFFDTKEGPANEEYRNIFSLKAQRRLEMIETFNPKMFYKVIKQTAQYESPEHTIPLPSSIPPFGLRELLAHNLKYDYKNCCPISESEYNAICFKSNTLRQNMLPIPKHVLRQNVSEYEINAYYSNLINVENYNRDASPPVEDPWFAAMTWHL